MTKTKQQMNPIHIGSPELLNRPEAAEMMYDMHVCQGHSLSYIATAFGTTYGHIKALVTEISVKSKIYQK